MWIWDNPCCSGGISCLLVKLSVTCQLSFLKGKWERKPLPPSTFCSVSCVIQQILYFGALLSNPQSVILGKFWKHSKMKGLLWILREVAKSWMSRCHFSQSIARKISSKSRKRLWQKAIYDNSINSNWTKVSLSRLFDNDKSHPRKTEDLVLQFPSENAEKNVVSCVVFRPS